MPIRIKPLYFYQKPYLLAFLMILLMVMPFFSSCAKAEENPGQGQPSEKEMTLGKRNEMIRPSAVRGRFYPSSPESLKGMIMQFLSQVPSSKTPENLIALICPHAGYIYSGEIAAYAYKLLEGKSIQTVILLGPSHYFPLRGASIWPGGAYQTPLGGIEVNEEMAAQIAQASESISFKREAHLREHSLEVQIPFLQMVLKDFQIVPILIGRISAPVMLEISQKLASILDKPGTLLIVSTDLSHYHPYDEATAMDRKTIEAIKSGDSDKLKTLVQDGEAELCGVMPVLLLLEAIKSINRPVAIKLLKYANSGDTAGTKEKVVGYAALSIIVENKKGGEQSDPIERGEVKLPETEELLNEKEKKKLLLIARSSIESYLKGKNPPKFEVTESRLLEPRGVFVTLHKRGMLRGCIGYIKPIMSLFKATSDCAVSAAAKDYRFPPLREEEMVEIDIEISALTPLHKIEDISEIKVGKHGLYISRSPYSGLLLPQVAAEYGWDTNTFLAQTCRKAGLPEDAWKKGADIYIFSAQIFGEKEG